ncbi:MAG: HNH endonuclease [Pseudomonadales bacterium]|nr:HNH endonuclease [Pseudomonadales bacterium]MCP5194021.1 HNH endonuclease [Pseudomonadales bacterium]
MNFEHWLTSIGKSPKTAKNYSGAIAGGLSSWAAEAGLVNQSLHELQCVDDFREACDKLRQLPMYLARNTVGKGMYNAALNTYADYLADVTQNELERDLGQIVDDQQLTSTEKSTLINTRIGQGQFRKKLIMQWGGCAVTGYRDTRFLVASHIKPWSKANNEERLDPFNGLLLLPNLDRVFDLGYISFEESGRIWVSSELEEAAVLGVEDWLSVKLDHKHQDYLAYHREKVFRH